MVSSLSRSTAFDSGSRDLHNGPAHRAARSPTAKANRLLLVERSAELRETLTAGLEPDFRVTAVGTLPLAQAELRDPAHQIILMDVALSAVGCEGLDLIRQLRAEQDHRAIVVAAFAHHRQLPADCYEAGADAFIDKPFRSLRELRQMLTSVAQRRAATIPTRVDRILFPRESFRFAGAVISPETMRARFSCGAEAPLKPKEVILLAFLSRHAGRLVLRSQILDEVWGPLADPGSKSLDTHLVRLRKTFGSHRVNLGQHLTVQAKMGWWVSTDAVE